MVKRKELKPLSVREDEFGAALVATLMSSLTTNTTPTIPGVSHLMDNATPPFITSNDKFITIPREIIKSVITFLSPKTCVKPSSKNNEKSNNAKDYIFSTYGASYEEEMEIMLGKKPGGEVFGLKNNISTSDFFAKPSSRKLLRLGTQNKDVRLVQNKDGKMFVLKTAATKIVQDRRDNLANYLLIKKGLMLPYVTYTDGDLTYTLEEYKPPPSNEPKYTTYLLEYANKLEDLNQDLLKANVNSVIVDNDLKWEQVLEGGMRCDIEDIKFVTITEALCSSNVIEVKESLSSSLLDDKGNHKLNEKEANALLTALFTPNDNMKVLQYEFPLLKDTKRELHEFLARIKSKRLKIEEQEEEKKREKRQTINTTVIGSMWSTFLGSLYGMRQLTGKQRLNSPYLSGKSRSSEDMFLFPEPGMYMNPYTNSIVETTQAGEIILRFEDLVLQSGETVINYCHFARISEYYLVFKDERKSNTLFIVTMNKKKEKTYTLQSGGDQGDIEGGEGRGGGDIEEGMKKK